MKFTLYLCVVSAAYFLGTEISSVEGLSCPTCFKMGRFGSLDCEMMDCNDAHDIDFAEKAIRTIMGQALDEVKDWAREQEFDLNTTAWGSQDFTDYLLQVWERSDPVCVKFVGSVGPPLNLSYLEASCRSRKAYEVGAFGQGITETPCLVTPNKDIYDIVGHPMTVDKFCVCDKNEHQNECTVSQEDRRKHSWGLINQSRQSDPSHFLESNISLSTLSGCPSRERASVMLVTGLVLVGLMGS